MTRRQRSDAPAPHPTGGAHDRSRMERLSAAMAQWTGSTPALAAAFGLVVVWLLSGPLFHYSDSWQLAINTTTTVVTFLMVFMIQRAQNKDAQKPSCGPCMSTSDALSSWRSGTAC